jgi:hypothetical protein
MSTPSLMDALAPWPPATAKALERLAAAAVGGDNAQDREERGRLFLAVAEDRELTATLAAAGEDAWRGPLARFRLWHGFARLVDGWAARIRAAARAERLDDEEREVVRAGPDTHRVVAELEAAVATHPDVYRAAGGLVVVAPDPETGRPVATHASPERLCVLASERAVLVDEKNEPIELRTDTARKLHAAAAWQDARPLRGIVSGPVLRPDGSVVQTNGYDEDSGYLVALDSDYPTVPEHPSKADAQAAIRTLLEVVHDFPANEVGKAAWLALVLTMVGRAAFEGPPPLFLVEGNSPGVGKGKLVNVAGIVANGRPAAAAPPPKGASADDEMRKRITSWVLSGAPLALIDNVSGPLGWPSLDSVLTTSRHGDRVLGGSRFVDVEVRTVFAATANNAEYAADVVRRVLPIRLVTKRANPEDRDDVTHRELEAWTCANRPRLLVAALTVLRAYLAAGGPPQRLAPWGSFEGWSALVRGALVWSGQPDPILTREGLRDRDEGATLLVRLLDGLEKLYPPTDDGPRRWKGTELLIDMHRCEHCKHPAHAGERFCRHDGPCTCPGYQLDRALASLREAVDELVNPEHPGRPISSKGLSRYLGALRERYAGDRCLHWRTDDGTRVYWVHRESA